MNNPFLILPNEFAVTAVVTAEPAGRQAPVVQAHEKCKRLQRTEVGNRLVG